MAVLAIPLPLERICQEKVSYFRIDCFNHSLHEVYVVLNLDGTYTPDPLVEGEIFLKENLDGF